MRKPACSPGSRVRYRANIKLSKEQDQKFNDSLNFGSEDPHPSGILTKSRTDLRVVELFAGAGGMGLGFLMAGNQKHGFRIIYSAEINPIYLRSLETNYKFFTKHSTNKLDNCIPSEFLPTDLTQDWGREAVQEAVKKADGVDIIIGGTPCQGFSPSNRRAWDSKNRYNQLVEYFIQYALELAPKVILLENVQGILWTPRSAKEKKRKVTVVDYISRKFTKAGYILFPAVLDAAWYGVPQHRNRFFLLALHKDLGYTVDDFGEWGAFPMPSHGAMGKYDYVTVKDAIADLPVVGNGESSIIQNYDEPTEEQLSLNSFLRQIPAIRIYLPQRLAERFFNIHTSDNLVREQCQVTHQPIQAIPLTMPGMRPTRRNVLNEHTVALVTYQGGRQYFPSLPISEPNSLGNQTQELDDLLSVAKYSDLKHGYIVTIDEILEILDFHFAPPDSGSTWKDDLIRQAVSALREQPRYQNTGTLVIINRDSNLKKSASRNYIHLGSVMPGDAGTVPYGVDRNFPALLMTRLRGEVDPEGGWHGVPFWVPVIRFPDGNYAFSVNYS